MPRLRRGSTRVSLRDRFLRLIPRDREFIVRSRGRVRYVRVGRISQSAVILLAALALGWSVFATERHLSHETILAERNAQIRELEQANEILSANLSEVRNKVEIQELSLTATQQTTIDLVAANQDFQFRIAELEGEVRDRRAQSQALSLSHMGALEAHADVAVDLENLELAQRDLKNKLAQRETQLSALDAERSSLNQTLSAANAELQKLKEEVGTLNYARVDLIGRLNDTHRDLQTVEKAKSRIVEEREGLGEQVVELSERLEMMETAQLDIVSRLGEQAGESGDSRSARLKSPDWMSITCLTGSIVPKTAVAGSAGRCWRWPMRRDQVWPLKSRRWNAGSMSSRACRTSWNVCPLLLPWMSFASQAGMADVSTRSMAGLPCMRGSIWPAVAGRLCT